MLNVDHLLILTYLMHHRELTSSEAARLCQRREIEARDIMSAMERDRRYLERGGTGKGTYWTLVPDLRHQLSPSVYCDRNGRMDWEAAKTRILSILKQQSAEEPGGLSNSEIRRITHFDRNQVFRLINELLREDSHLKLTGKGRYARYFYTQEHN